MSENQSLSLETNCVIRVQTSIRDIISLYTHRIFSEIFPPASFWLLNAGAISPSKSPARLSVIVHGVKLGCKPAQGIYLLIHTQVLNE